MLEPEGEDLHHLDLERATDEAPEELRRLILFQACDEWFSLPIEWVREIQPLSRVTRVPNSSPAILGIMNLRGRVLALVDVAGCLGIGPGKRPTTHVVVLDAPDPDLCVGLTAQRIGQVRRVSATVVDRQGREGGVGVLEGVFSLEGEVVGLLDLPRLVSRALSEWEGKSDARRTT